MTHWTLNAWPPLLWQADSVSRLQMCHRGTRVLADGESDPVCGETLWSGRCERGVAGLAWHWVQVLPGVVALVDPMALESNLRLLGPAGQVLTTWESARHLNCIVHALPWQNEVQRALAGVPAAELAAP